MLLSKSQSPCRRKILKSPPLKSPRHIASERDPLPIDGGAVKLLQLIDQSAARRKELEECGKFVEAEACKRRIKKIKAMLDKMELQHIRQKHQQQIYELQITHEEELKYFTQQWQGIFSRLQGEAAEAQQQLLFKYQRIIEDGLGQSSGSGERFKESAELLNLRKIEQELAKQEKYIDAHKVKLSCQKMLEAQLVRWHQSQSKKDTMVINAAKQRRDVEMKTLKQRCKLIVEEKQKESAQERQNMLMNYSNIKKELQRDQSRKIQHLERVTNLNNQIKK